MKKKKYKKIIMIYIGILLFIILFLIGILSLVNNTSIEKKVENKLTYINGNEWNNETYPEGMPKFFRYYSGGLTAKNIGKSIYYISTEAIPRYNLELKEFSDEEIKDYYDKNKSAIFLELGDISKDKFVSFINEIKKIELENFEIEKFYIDSDSIVKENNSTKANLCIKYKGANEILIKIRALNSFKQECSSIKYYR